MFYATPLEKLGLFSILLKSCEKISLGQDSFDNSDIEELSDPYLFLQPQNYSKKENLPADFLSQFNSLLQKDYWEKKFESSQRDDLLLVNDVGLCRVKIESDEEITKVLNAHYFIKDALEIVINNFKKQSEMSDLIIRVIELFSHYIVVSNLGLPLSKIEKSRPLECDTPRNMLYNFLGTSEDIPQFIVLLQRKWQNSELRKTYHLILNEETKGETEAFVIKAKTLGEISKDLINKFQYTDTNSFKEYGAWFPLKLYYCDKCNKLHASSENHISKYCCGLKDLHHSRKQMKEFSGIILHKNFSQVFPYISEHLAIHTLRRLLYEDKLSGFFAHSVLFEDEEIDIIALILLKNYIKIFPIEIQLSSKIETSKVEEKFYKLEKFIKESNYQQKYIKIYNLLITFDKPEEREGKNYTIHPFTELNKMVENYVFST